MAKYNHSDITGESWTRCFRIEITNPLPNKHLQGMPAHISFSAPTIFFGEEVVVNIGDETYISQPTNNDNSDKFAIDFLTANTSSETFKIVDSNGNETEETATYSDVYKILSSMYAHVAKKRDIKMQNIPTPQEIMEMQKKQFESAVINVISNTSNTSNTTN